MKERHAVPLVAVGGFFGATARYGADVLFGSPMSTFAVNVVGCFALGYLLYSYRLDGFSERLRLLAATGFISSFTTYSTFAHEVFVASPVFAVAYVAVSYAVGFSAVAVGAYTAGGYR